LKIFPIPILSLLNNVFKLNFFLLFLGWLWGIANTAFFIATDILSQSVTFPIANSGPAVVAFILGLFYREIKGFRNLATLALGLFVAIAGIICSGLSY
jgi:glucose uptake protein GlcU